MPRAMRTGMMRVNRHHRDNYRRRRTLKRNYNDITERADQLQRATRNNYYDRPINTWHSRRGNQHRAELDADRLHITVTETGTPDTVTGITTQHQRSRFPNYDEDNAEIEAEVEEEEEEEEEEKEEREDNVTENSEE